MKTLKYLSPTSISTWLESKEMFYLKYLAEDAPERQKQTQPMSVGSAFDAYVKSFIHNALFKDDNPKFVFETLFTSQVESQNRDFALVAGKICFDAYRKSGALADLMLVLRDCDEEPQFEFTVQGTVDGVRDGFVGDVGGVVLLGKPDAYFKNKENRIVLDWKVNGYCSTNGHSPKPGYVMIRDGFDGKPSRGANKPHKDCYPVRVGSMQVNGNTPMDDVEADWARQTAIYGWLLGNPVGSKFICAIDQLVCKPGSIRVAEHRCYISPQFQEETLQTAREIWEVCKTNHIFREYTPEDSLQIQSKLDSQAKLLNQDPELKALLS